MEDWRVWFYPELARLPAAERERVWRLASDEPFRAIERLLIVAGFGVAVLAVRYAAFRSIFGAFVAFAADFIVAGGILLLTVGPAYWLRTKRGLTTLRKKRDL